MRTFLLVNISGDFLSIAQRLKEEGEKILFWRSEKPLKGGSDVGKGIIDEDEFVEDYYEVLKKVPKNDLYILVDDNCRGDEFDFIKRAGYKVIGASGFGDKIEYDRTYGTELMEKIGLPTPKTFSFDSIEEAIRLAYSIGKRNPQQRLVFKPHGEEFAGSARTYTAKNMNDLIDYLEWTQDDIKRNRYEIERFELQEFIDGYEVDFSAYFNGVDFMPGSVAIDIEEKKAGDGNKGQSTGCMGNVILFVEKSRYFDKYIRRLRKLLQSVGYVGQISINNIFAKKDGMPYGLEFTPRFGWDAQLTECSIFKEAGLKLADFYTSIADKKDFPFPHDLVGCGVRVYCETPGVPKDEIIGRRFGFDKEIEKNLWFYSVSKEKDNYIVEGNEVLVANAVDKKLQKAIDKVYNDILPKVYISDIYYRMEIGKRAKEALKFLLDNKWI